MKSNKALAISIIIVISVSIGASFISDLNDINKKERLEKDKINNFKINREKILSNLKDKVSAGALIVAKQEIDSHYLNIDDFELNKIREQISHLLNLNKSKEIFYSSDTSINSVDNRIVTNSKRMKVIEKQFWVTGEHINLGLAIRKSLHDRSSFEHLRSTYLDKGDFLIIKMDYRAKNGFGVTVLDSVIAKVSLDGKVLGRYTE